jgi:hypothetical protein
VLEVAEGYAGRMERKRDEKDRVLLIRSLRADLDGARGVTSSWAPVPVAATVGARRWWALPPLGLAFLGVLVSMPILLANAGPEFGGLAVIDALLIGAAGFVVGALLSISIWIALVVWRRVARRPAGR